MKKVFVFATLLFVFSTYAFAQGAKKPAQTGMELDQHFKDTWEALTKTSVIWPQIDDNKMRAQIISMYIGIFKQNGIKITNSPVYYVARLSEIYNENPALFKNPFNVVLQTIAIIDYDFDNRQDKDYLAKQILGEQGFIANKKRLGLMK